MTMPSSLRRTRIKVCGFTREQDLAAAAAAGVDAVGFVLYEKSPRAITPQRAGELARTLPPFVTPVLLFVNASDALLAAAAEAVPHAIWQFHGDETPERCHAVTRNGQRAFLRAARISLDDAAPPFNLLEFSQQYSHAQAILVDAHVEGYGGGGKTFNWSRLSTNVSVPLVLSGGLTPANVGDGVRLLAPRCKSLSVDVSSGVESAKGIKDADKIRDFVAAVRAADALPE